MNRSIKLIGVLLITGLALAGCGRKGALKPPPDARPMPEILDQQDDSSSSNQPAASEPVSTQ